MSRELIERIDTILQNEVVSRHSYFQLKHFIIGQEPTHQARLWQCLRELKTRREAIVAIKREIEDTNDKLALLDIKEKRARLASESPPQHILDKEEQEINERRRQRRKDSLLDALAHLKEKQKSNLEEARLFVQAFEGLEKIAPLKPFDDLESQKEYWNARLTEEMNMRMLLQLPVDVELVKTILALHNDAPIKRQTLHMLDYQQSQLQGIKEKDE